MNPFLIFNLYKTFAKINLLILNKYPMKILFWLLLLPTVLFGQSKTEWTYYSAPFSYFNERFSDLSFSPAGKKEIILRDDGTIIFIPESKKDPITFFKNNIEYPIDKVTLPKFKNFVDRVENAAKLSATKDVQVMLLDKKGNLWLGSYAGLFRIDAAATNQTENISSPLEVMPIDNETPGMPFASIALIAEDLNGNIWVTGSPGLKIPGKGLSKYDGNQWTNFEIDEFPNLWIKKIVFDDQNDPIVLFSNNTIAQFKNAKWTSLGKLDMLPVALHFGNHKLYAATSSDMWEHTGEKWQKVEIKTSHTGITDLKTDKQGAVWISTGWHVIGLMPNKIEIVLSAKNSILPESSVRRIFVDNQNKKWFITDTAIIGFKEASETRNASMTIFNKFNSSLPPGPIESMIAVKDKLMVVSRDAGLMEFDGVFFKNLTPSDKKEAAHSNIAVDKDGKISMGSTRFLHQFDGNTYSVLEWKGEFGKQADKVVIDNDNNIWISSFGVAKFNGTTWEAFNKKNAGLPSNSCTGLFVDTKNNLWATFSDGIGKYDGSAWTIYTKKTAGVNLSTMYGIAESKDGKMWFCNGFKLIEFDGIAMKESAGFKSVGAIRNMVMDENGTLLIATEEKGIAKVKDGIVSFCDKTTGGLPTNSLNYIYKDTQGKIWVAYGRESVVEHSFPAMGQQQATPTPAPVVNPKDAFSKKILEFEPLYGLIQLNKY
jgi:ligand-binding sensor domain-containing protein